MKQRTLLVAAGIGAFLLFLIASMPAGLLAVPAETLGLRLTGVHGTVWRGGAASAQVQGLTLRRLSWHLSPLALLTGRINAELEARLPGGSGHTRLLLTAAGRLVLTELDASVAIAPAAAALGLTAGNGDVVLRFDQLELMDGWISRVAGMVRVDHYLLLPAQGDRPAVTVGLEARFDAGDGVGADGLVTAQVEDLNGPFELHASLRLSPPGNYALAGRIAARPGAPDELVQGLTLLGTPSPEGGYEFSITGSL